MQLDRHLRAVFAKVLAGLMALAMPSFVLAELVNTARVSYQNSLGHTLQEESNTVTVLVSSRERPLVPPGLDLPKYLPVNAQIRASYTGRELASYFVWSFTPVSSIPMGTSAGGLNTVSPATIGSFTTSGPQANLGSIQLGLGLYSVAVKVYDHNNNASVPAQAYVTLVAGSLGGVRVFPNPWRSDQHTGPVTFDGLTLGTTVKIFTLSGHFVKSLTSAAVKVTWDLTNESGDKVASGLYLYVATDTQGHRSRGKLTIIK